MVSAGDTARCRPKSSRIANLRACGPLRRQAVSYVSTSPSRLFCIIPIGHERTRAVFWALSAPVLWCYRHPSRICRRMVEEHRTETVQKGFVTIASVLIGAGPESESLSRSLHRRVPHSQKSTSSCSPRASPHIGPMNRAWNVFFD